MVRRAGFVFTGGRAPYKDCAVLDPLGSEEGSGWFSNEGADLDAMRFFRLARVNCLNWA